MTRSEQEGYALNKARVAALEHRKGRIRSLNDDLRKLRTGGRIMLTQGVNALGMLATLSILDAVAAFDSFTHDSDPHDEHDFGAIEWDGQRLFWKIDYYDLTLEFGSPDPAEPSVTARVLTIMLASEY